MLFHAIATLSGNRKKSIVNKSDDRMLAEIVMPFVATGTIKAKWGEKIQSYQVLELRIYQTDGPWDRKTGGTLEEFIGKRLNQYKKFEKKANAILGKESFKVFVVMPIQGEKYGTQNDQRIYKEFDERFQVIEKTIGKLNCVAIRIDKEVPLEDMVTRIKKEIHGSSFVIADLTEERPSCYFEAGYAEAINRKVIYIASKDSVRDPNIKTKVHFDIHMHVNYFINHKELQEKLKTVIEKHKEKLLVKV
jgi:hypothetical protein